MTNQLPATIVLLTLTACGGSTTQGERTSTPAAMTPSAEASGTQLYDAIGVALERYPSALPYEVEIDDETAHLGFLEVELWVGDVATELFIDPGTMAIVDEGVDTADAGEEAAHAETHARLVAGEASLRAALDAGLLNSYDASHVIEIEMTVLEGHLVIAVTQNTGGGLTYHEAGGAHLGTADEARTRWQSEAQATPPTTN